MELNKVLEGHFHQGALQMWPGEQDCFHEDRVAVLLGLSAVGRVSRLVEELSRFIDTNSVWRQTASCRSLTCRSLGIDIAVDAPASVPSHALNGALGPE